MKKIFLFSAIMLITSAITIQAQFSVNAGLNLSKMKLDDAFDGESIKMRPGFHVGAAYGIGIAGGLSFEPGLGFTTKGVNAEYEDDFLSSESNMNVLYLRIPVNIKYAIPAGPVKILIEAGPSLNMGVNGNLKYKAEESGQTISVKYDIKFDSDGDEEAEEFYMKRFDVGLKAGLAVQIKSFIVGFNYEWGLSNLDAYAGDGEIKNRVMGITLGYAFGK
jgi:hypothetical protein